MDCTARLYALLSAEEHVTRSALLRGLRTVSASDLDAALARIRDKGRLDERMVRPVRGRPHTTYRLSTPPRASIAPARLMVLRDDLWAEQRRAEARVVGWIAELGGSSRDTGRPDRRRAGDQCALDVLVALYRAPHLYGAKSPAQRVREALDQDYEGGIWRLGLRRLAQLGVIHLRERRDAPALATLCLANPPPMAMQG